MIRKLPNNFLRQNVIKGKLDFFPLINFPFDVIKDLGAEPFYWHGRVYFIGCKVELVSLLIPKGYAHERDNFGFVCDRWKQLR